MPFHVWCDRCGDLIGKGVRFNAEKQQTGTYLSTRIWSFTMRHHCGCCIVVRTDPKTCEYIVESGAKRKVCTGTSHVLSIEAKSSFASSHW
jgi:coiled-coil domain-containing protein 130